MNTFKHSLRARRKKVMMSGLCFLILAQIMVLSPAINPLQKVQAAIDEAMPSNIPADVVSDWKDQGGTAEQIKASLPAEYQSKCDGSFNSACHWRRVARMKPYAAEIENILFCRHHNFGGILVGYHDNADRANSDMCWSSQGALCHINFKNYYSTFTEILTKTNAVVRDPCVSFDGKKVLIAISGNGTGTGYKIYEMDISDLSKPGTPKQITDDPGVGTTVADFEPCYLPNGDIMFTSTRNFGFVDCATNPTTNMFLMNGDGKYIHQVGFDQVHTFYPVLMEDGSVLYTRWEYNDRDITNTMGLFYMYPDGAHQTEWFGNQNGWPFSLLHGRPVPGTNNRKVMAVGGGHHGPYCGDLCIIDRLKGTNGAQSLTMMCPKAEAKPRARKSDISMGNADFRFAYPYPLDEDNLLVSWRKAEMASGGSGGMGSRFDGKFNLYFMNIDGGRELLATASQSVCQVVSCKPWDKVPPKIMTQANYNETMGECTMQDVYQGEGLKKKDGQLVAKGTAKSIRVIALHYRIFGASFPTTMGSAPSGLFAPAIFGCVSQYGASWEAKEVLGEAPIFPDGSAAFKVPARRPVYFQLIDSMGYAIATVRSWITLMPGEKFACVGCHENKITSPPPAGSGLAGTPKPLETPLGIENKPFDYTTMVQPIFDKKCVSCHKSGHSSGFDLSGGMVKNAGRNVPASYSSLLKGIGSKSSNNAVNICYMFQQPPQQPAYSFGACQSGIMTKALNGTNTSMNKLLTENEKKIIACWIDLACPAVGSYTGGLSASDVSRVESAMAKRTKWQAIEKKNLEALAAVQEARRPDNHGSVNATRFTEQLRIGYVPTTRTLVLKEISKGNLKVLDLQGRVLYCLTLSHPQAKGNVEISLPAPLGMGLYVARFESVKGVQQAKISIME